MTQEIRKFLHDIIASCLGLSGNQVIWQNQGGPQPNNPVVTLFVYSNRGQAMAEAMPVDEKGESVLKVPTDAVLQVQYFDKKGQFPVDKLENLVRLLEAPNIVEQCATAGVAFFDSEDVLDVAALLPNQQQYEPRASVDLHFRYTAEVSANVNIIDTVNVEGETDGRELVFSVSSKTSN